MFTVFAKHLRYGRQEDAHEFLRYFIDSLQKVCLHGYPAKLDIYSKHTTVIHQIFGGYHRSQGMEMDSTLIQYKTFCMFMKIVMNISKFM